MEYSVEGESISNIADAIRERSGSEDPMSLSQMPGLIRNLPGGGEGHKVTISLNSSSHQYSADASYADISEWLSNSEYVYAEYNGDIFLLNKYTNEVVDFVQVEDIDDGTKAFQIRIFEIRTQGGPVGYSVTGSPIIYAPGSSNVGKYLKSVETGTGTYAYEPSDLPEEEQIISYADYMALTDAQKNNGKSYYIYDAQNEGREIQPVIYSLDEREIGVWTDGKPLYQKTFFPGYITPSHTSGAKNVNVTIDVHDYNIETFVNAFGVWERWAGDDAKLLIQYGGYDSDGYERSRIRIDSENGYTNGRMNLYMYTDGTDWQCITIQYTKTTDTPGAGHFIPSGVPAVNYDGNEKIIGTWFGETLYEKTVKSTTTLTAGISNQINTGITDASEIVSIEGFVSYGSHTVWKALPSSDSGNSVITFGGFNSSTGILEITVGSNYSSSYAIDLVYATIRYTKSTS